MRKQIPLFAFVRCLCFRLDSHKFFESDGIIIIVIVTIMTSLVMQVSYMCRNLAPNIAGIYESKEFANFLVRRHGNFCFYIFKSSNRL